MLIKIGTFLLISLVIYLGITAVLITTNQPTTKIVEGPLDCGNDLAAITQPLLVVAGMTDESFIAEQYEPTISAHTDSGTYILLPNIGHIDLLTTPDIEPLLTQWLDEVGTLPHVLLTNICPILVNLLDRVRQSCRVWVQPHAGYPGRDRVGS